MAIIGPCNQRSHEKFKHVWFCASHWRASETNRKFIATQINLLECWQVLVYSIKRLWNEWQRAVEPRCSKSKLRLVGKQFLKIFLLKPVTNGENVRTEARLRLAKRPLSLLCESTDGRTSRRGHTCVHTHCELPHLSLPRLANVDFPAVMASLPWRSLSLARVPWLSCKTEAVFAC